MRRRVEREARRRGRQARVVRRGAGRQPLGQHLLDQDAAHAAQHAVLQDDGCHPGCT